MSTGHTSGHLHMPHRHGHGDEQPPSEGASPWHGRLELLITVLLGMAAIFGAWAALRNEQHNHDATEQFSEGIKNFDDSGQYYSTANQTFNQDQALFLAYAQSNFQKRYDLSGYIKDSLMGDTLKAGVNWWENTKTNANSPFVPQDPKYDIPQLAAAQQSAATSSKNFKEAKTQQNRADHFTIVEVILATALFLYGIAGVTRNMTVKLGTLGTGFVIFATAVVIFFT
jgi:hypothetical protein